MKNVSLKDKLKENFIVRSFPYLHRIPFFPQYVVDKFKLTNHHKKGKTHASTETPNHKAA